MAPCLGQSEFGALSLPAKPPKDGSAVTGEERREEARVEASPLAGHFVRLSRFVGSAAAATITHLAIMYAVSALTNNVHLAFAAGFLGGVLLRYFVDRYFVFQAKRGQHRHYLPRYLLACGITYVVSASLFALFLDIFGWPTTIAFGSSVILTTLVGYVVLGRAFAETRMSS